MRANTTNSCFNFLIVSTSTRRVIFSVSVYTPVLPDAHPSLQIVDEDTKIGLVFAICRPEPVSPDALR